jgi:threonine dehydratase
MNRLIGIIIQTGMKTRCHIRRKQENRPLPHHPQAGDTPVRSVRFPSSADLDHARSAVSRYLPPTPLLRSGTTWLKLESLQPTGSFKVRGAIAAVSAAPPESRILAASAGNHALGIAWAAAQLNVRATVVIAETASAAKRARLESFPVELIRHGPSIEAAEALALEQLAEGAGNIHYISPYNDPLVIAGQATIVDELVAQAPAGPLRLVVPLGGGGLLAGIALRASQLRAQGQEIDVIGVEASESLAVSTAVAAGRTVLVPIGATLADGLAGNIEAGSITVDLIREHVDRLLSVSEERLRQAIRWLVQEHGIVAEGAGAAAIAAILERPELSDGPTTIAIISGRNIAWETLLGILNESRHDPFTTEVTTS